MALLAWKHGTTRTEAGQIIQSRLRSSGYHHYVTWDGDFFTASIGWGAVLDVTGRVDDKFIILEKSRGAMGDVVLHQCENAFEEIFPGGKQTESLQT